MAGDWSPLSPYQTIGHAWNQIMSVKGEVPAEAYDNLAKALEALDLVLLCLHPKATIEPIPFYNPNCDHCTRQTSGQ